MITSYDQFTLGAFCALADIDARELDDLDRQVEILAVLSGATTDDILRLPLDEYSRRVLASRFLDEPMPQRLPQRSYKVGEFDLAPVRDMKHLTTAQFVDFKTFVDSADGDKTTLIRLTPQLLSCMLTPKGRDYCDGYDPMDVQAALRDHLRADDAIALSAFFLASWMKRSARILASSRRVAKRMKRRDILRKIREVRQSRKVLLTTSPHAGDGRR